jgi:ATP-dependent DNA helicase DinG
MTNVNLVDAELDIAEALVEFLFKPFSSTILCSATLTTNKKFNFVRHRLGLTPQLLGQRVVTENVYESPFDYSKQAILVVPTDMPSPLEVGFLPAAMETIWDIVKASRGAAFVLFTSYSMLKQCYEKMATQFKEQRFTLLKQGDDNRQSLLQKFKTTPRAVLFGTDSFWEGVDVSGEALRCVIIVKLPFKVPTEPITQARTEAISAKGQDPFFEYSLPNAIVKFKQGFGRLIRHRKDRGCIVCLDSRLITKRYGQQFLNSLPTCQQLRIKRANIVEEMTSFFKKTHYLTTN